MEHVVADVLGLIIFCFIKYNEKHTVDAFE